MTKLISLLKKKRKNNIIDDPKNLSLGSLYFIESPIEIYNANTLIAMPVSIRQSSTLLYFVCVYEYNVLKYSNNSITIFPSIGYKARLLAEIIRIFNIKLDEKVVSRIINLLAGEFTNGKESGLELKVRRKGIDLVDNVTELDNQSVLDLKLHLIKRIMDVSKWPRVAIKSWAQYHLELETTSIERMYSPNFFSDFNNKKLVDILQKHYTYSAGKHKQEEEIGSGEIMQRYETTGYETINGETFIVNTNTNIGTNTDDRLYYINGENSA